MGRYCRRNFQAALALVTTVSIRSTLGLCTPPLILQLLGFRDFFLWRDALHGPCRQGTAEAKWKCWPLQGGGGGHHGGRLGRFIQRGPRGCHHIDVYILETQLGPVDRRANVLSTARPCFFNNIAIQGNERGVYM